MTELGSPFSLSRLLTQAVQAHRQASLARLRAMGHATLTLATANILLHIDTVGTRLTTIAERSEMTKQSASQLVAELERLGYVQREREAEDARAQRIRFTRQGLMCRNDLLAISSELEGALVAAVGSGHASSFCLILSRLPELFQPATGSQRATPSAAARPVAKHP